MPNWGKPGRPFWHAAKVAEMWKKNGGSRAGAPVIAKYDAPQVRPGRKRPPKTKPKDEKDVPTLIALASLGLLLINTLRRS
jgi:hypothetical protein